MSFRVGGALALIAAVLLAVSLATSAWWSGHPSTDGHERAMQTVSIGLSGGEGCNTGGEGGCKKILLGGTFKTMSGLVLILGALTALAGFALAVMVQTRRKERVPLARTALGAGALLAVLALLLVVIGPDMIKAPAGTSVPLGVGALVGIVGALVMVAGGVLGGRPEIARPLSPTSAGAIPPEQLHFAPPAADFPVAPWMAPPPPPPPPVDIAPPVAPWMAPPPVRTPPPRAAAPPPMGKFGPTHEGALPFAPTELLAKPPIASPPPSPSPLRPPPPSVGWTLPRTPEPLAGPSGPLSPRAAPQPPPAFVTTPSMPRAGLRPPTAPPPVPSAFATLRKPPPAPAAPPPRVPTVPPPLSPLALRTSTALRSPTSPPPFAARPAKLPPPLQIPTPASIPVTSAAADDERTTGTQPVDDLDEAHDLSETHDLEQTDDRTDANVRAAPEAEAEAEPELAPAPVALAREPEATAETAAPSLEAATEDSGGTDDVRTTAVERVSEPALRPSMANATTPFPRMSEELIASSPRPPSRAELSEMLELAALAERAAPPTDAHPVAPSPALAADLDPPTGPASPIVTAAADLPPPDPAPASTSSGPSPACPQCDAPMAWVEAHLRFYCKSCKMYF